MGVWEPNVPLPPAFENIAPQTSAPRPAPDPICICGHWAQLHSPTGRLADTTERGTGPCTCGCLCDGYRMNRKRKP